MLSALQNKDASMPNVGIALLIFSALLWNNACVYSNIAADCCLSTSNTSVPLRIVESYANQTMDSGCQIPATIFITKKNRKLCSPPVTDTRYPWVAKLIQFLDKRSSKSKGAQ